MGAVMIAVLFVLGAAGILGALFAALLVGIAAIDRTRTPRQGNIATLHR